MVGVEFVVVGPADQVAVVPLARAYLNTEWQAILIKPRGDTDRRQAQHVDPVCVAVRPVAYPAILRHRLVNGRHLVGWINEAVEVQPLELCLIPVEHIAPWSEQI